MSFSDQIDRMDNFMSGDGMLFILILLVLLFTGLALLVLRDVKIRGVINICIGLLLITMAISLIIFIVSGFGYDVT